MGILTRKQKGDELTWDEVDGNFEYLDNGLGEKLNMSDAATVATSGSYNDLSDTPTIPAVPSNVSEFNNDAGYQTSDQVNTAIQNVVGAAPAALDTLAEIAAQLESDESAASALASAVAKKADDSSLATVAKSGKYADLSGKPSIPTKVSDLLNDLGFSSGGGSVSNANLLINPEFTVNQLGAASITATANAYNFDQWYYDGTYLYQGIEASFIAGGVYTVSWAGGSGVSVAYSYNPTGSWGQTSQAYASVANGAQISVTKSGSNILWVRLQYSTLPTYIKVESGATKTPYIQRHQLDELKLCQRYLSKVTCVFSVVGMAPSLGGFIDGSGMQIKYPVQMRASPTITMASASAYFYLNQISPPLFKTYTTYPQLDIDENGMSCSFDTNGLGFSNGSLVQIITKPGFSYVADARL